MRLIDYLNEEIRIPRITHLGYFLFFWITTILAVIKIIDNL